MSKYNWSWIKKVALWKVILFFTLTIVTMPIMVMLLLFIWISDLIYQNCLAFLDWYIYKLVKLRLK